MKTKYLLLGAGFIVAQMSLLPGQTSFPINASGYVNVTIPARQFALLANPLNKPTNTLDSVLPTVPTGTQVFKFDSASQTFVQFTKQPDGSWSGTGVAVATLNPGEGFFIKNTGQEFQLIFDAEVPQGTLAVEVPVGFSLLGSKVPQQGRLETELGFPARVGTKVYLFRNGSYTQYTKRASIWTGGSGEPVLNVAEGFFVLTPVPLTWTRQFRVAP